MLGSETDAAQAAQSNASASPADRDFPFPFTPWNIQISFMSNLYDTLEDRKVGIFESPTGTGKSLSIVCGALKWLRDKQSASIDDILREQEAAAVAAGRPAAAAAAADNEPDWVIAHERQQKREALAQRLARAQRRREDREMRLKRIRDRDIKESTRLAFKRKAEETLAGPADRVATVDTHYECLVDDYQSDEDACPTAVRKSGMTSQHGTGLDSDSDDDDKDDEDADADEDLQSPQIIYAARTHSQIAQFVHEINKTVYKDIKCITLGSRKNMCINDSVIRLQSLSKINDRCLELHKRDETSKSGCPYHLQDKLQMITYDDLAHAHVRDIEELVKIGRRSATCPYYGSRHAAISSEIVCVPYNLLLQQTARDSIGLRLKNNIVILDEAHNIIETVNSLHSHSVSLAQVQACTRHLTAYFDRYKRRLAGKNVVYIKQLLIILAAFNRLLGKSRASSSPPSTAPTQTLASKPDSLVKDTVMTLNEFVNSLGVDHFNLFKIQKYLANSRLPQKLLGFALKDIKEQQQQQQQQAAAAAAAAAAAQPAAASSAAASHQHRAIVRSPLAFLDSFLASLTHADLNGRVVVAHHADPNQCVAKYLLLNPADSFAPILQQARAVVFAGGTMSPIRDFVDQVAPPVCARRPTALFSCGHIISSTSLLPMCVSAGPTGVPFDFSHERRSDPALMDETGNAIANYCNVVPGGIVVFFVSYSHLDAVTRRWRISGLWERISKRKHIFTEPASVAAVDQVLRDYSDAVYGRKKSSTSPSTQTGGLLLAVVSGKLSEGINFSDDMGRAVIMVGLPFANITSIELREKMRFFDAQAKATGSGQTGSEYYENLCMRAVNQSIGRAIRHKDDYATIILLDGRFKRERLVAKLPQWIRDCHLQMPPQFGPTMALVSRFFAAKKV
ncbi:helicase C-terminal domain-containing protein [Entophlyctis helioformis]|nr:helicase C-terminal domain-containing protein [Entophlyctis helioformis]